VLEFFSENQVTQIILFLLEVGFFFVLGWNMSKLALETRTSTNSKPTPDTGINPIVESSLDEVEIE
jgi:hypothetical protein